MSASDPESSAEDRTTSDIRSIVVLPRIAKAGDRIEIKAEGVAGGRARFSIARVPGAADVTMIESTDAPGTYLGAYLVAVGENAEHAAVTVVLTTPNGRTIAQDADQTVTIDTVPPRIPSLDVAHQVVSNGETLRINAVCEARCHLVLDVSELDTTQTTVSVDEEPRESGRYEAAIVIHAENKAPNGVKKLYLVARDAAGNESERANAAVELKNSELHAISAIGADAANVLSMAGIRTLADLRRIDVANVGRETGLPSEELGRYRSAAMLRAVGISPTIADALVRFGGIRSLSELALTPRGRVAEILEVGTREGVLPPAVTARADLPDRLIAGGMRATAEYLQPLVRHRVVAANSCQSECQEERSALGCFAYLLELIRLSGLTWAELNDTFRQDFGAVTEAPTRQVDISVRVLERAIRHDLGNPSRRDSDWRDHDTAVNDSLVRILVNATGQSEVWLEAAFPNAFDAARPLGERNEVLEVTLRDPALDNAMLLRILRARTGRSGAELAVAHPEVFDPGRSLQERNSALMAILKAPGLTTSVVKVKAGVAGLRLKALLAQSGQTGSELRRRYFIPFSPDDCGETTTCRQAILTLQEYLAEKAYADLSYRYPSYDQWRLEQTKRFYPQNVYSHEFKTSLIRGDRQLLREHLEQARALLDRVRVSEDGRAPSPDDPSALLSSFRWRNPYHTNLTTGLDLVTECYEVDDLMVKGHAAFTHEEYQQARQHYLAAAEKIRRTSKRISQGMVLLPLWAGDGEESYFGSHSALVGEEATTYLNNVGLSYANANEPGVELARGEVRLNGVDIDGTFMPMRMAARGIGNDERDAWKNLLDGSGWKAEDFSGFVQYYVDDDGRLHVWLNDDGYKANAPLGEASQWSPGGGFLYYDDAGRTQWTDYAVEVESEIRKGDFNAYVPDGTGSSRYGYVQRYRDCLLAIRYEPTAFHGIALDPVSEEQQIAKWSRRTGVFDRPAPGQPPYVRKFTPTEGLYRIRVEVRGSTLRAEYWLRNDGHWDPIGSFPQSPSQPPIELPLPAQGLFGFGSEFEGLHTRIKAWDLSKALGAVSDAAFFLNPSPKARTGLGFYLFAYTARKRTVSDRTEVSNFGPFSSVLPSSLPTKLSIRYGEVDRIVAFQGAKEEPYDPFYQEAGSRLGLWNGPGDARLHRGNLRRLLDGFPMLFCHQYFFLLPVCLGDVANALGQYEEALQWYRLVYDERNAPGARGKYPWLNPEVEGEMLRIRIARNYVEWGDFMMTENTEESVNEARIRYRRALGTLGTEPCCERERVLDEKLRSLIADLDLRAAVPARTATEIYRTIIGIADLPGKRAATLALIDDVARLAATATEPSVTASRITGLFADRVPALKSPLPLSAVVERERTLVDRLWAVETAYPAVLDDAEASIRVNEGRPLAAPARAATAPASTAVPFRTVPRDMYADASFRDMYSRIGRFIGLPAALLPEPAVLPTAPDPSIRAGVLTRFPAWALYSLCIPGNPVSAALTARACLGIRHIDICFNALGFPRDDLSVYRFEYLIAMAKNFAQMALAAEKDFIQFKQQFEQGTFELMNAAQAIAISHAAAGLAELRVNEALDQMAAANLGVESVNAQIEAIKTRLDESGSFWEWTGAVVGSVAVGAASTPALGIQVGAWAGLSSAIGIMASREEQEENLEMQLHSLKTVQLNAARQSLTNAFDAERSAHQQARIAQLEAQFAAERAGYLATEFFNPQLWSFLAQEVKKNYRTYLTFGNVAAWLAQRALEFERGVEPGRRFARSGPSGSRSGLNVVRFDYFQPAQQGLLGADSLLRDIATLEYDKLVHEQRKKQITKVISLASTQPFAFAKFLETGVLPFAITLDEFDQDFPGHYQRRIRNVRVNLFGLIGPDGIKATLTCLGNSQIVVSEFNGGLVPAFVTKTLRRPQESIALTSPQGGGIGAIPLSPDGEMRNPFEGSGVATEWLFELPKYANKLDYNTITDIQLLVDYTALDSKDYREQVLKRLPRQRGNLRAFSCRLEFPDALFHLKDSPLPLSMVRTSDGMTGAYTLLVETEDSDFPPNEGRRTLKDVVLYARSRGQTPPPDFSALHVSLSSGSTLTSLGLGEADLGAPGSLADAETPPPPSPVSPNYIGRWQPAQTSVVDKWYIFVPPDQNQNFLKRDDAGAFVLVNGKLVFDFSQIEDLILAVSYTYEVPLPQL